MLDKRASRYGTSGQGFWQRPSLIFCLSCPYRLTFRHTEPVQAKRGIEK